MSLYYLVNPSRHPAVPMTSFGFAGADAMPEGSPSRRGIRPERDWRHSGTEGTFPRATRFDRSGNNPYNAYGVDADAIATAAPHTRAGVLRLDVLDKSDFPPLPA